jgi:hypothetical protein
MEFMKLTTSRNVRNLYDTMRASTNFIDRRLWLSRYEQLKSIVTRNPYMKDVIDREYKIEMGVGFIFSRYRSVRSYPSLGKYPNLYDAYAFLNLYAEIRSKLTERGRNKLDGMVKGGLNKSQSIGPISFEFAVAVHFAVNGYLVAFNDLEQGAGADILAKRDDLIIEAECKHVSGEIGDPIHKKDFRAFVNLLAPRIEGKAPNVSCALVMLIRIPGRLKDRDGYFADLSKLVEKALCEKKAIKDESGHAVELVVRPAPTWLAYDTAVTFSRQEIKKIYGVDNSHAVFIGQRNGSCIVIGMVSSRPRKVLGNLFEQLRRSAEKQFSGHYPSILCSYLSALSVGDLKSLAGSDQEPTALEQAVKDFFYRRQSISMLGFISSDQPIWTSDRLVSARSQIGLAREALWFRNRLAPKTLPEGLSLFPATSSTYIRSL